MKRLVAWYKAGLDVQAMLPALCADCADIINRYNRTARAIVGILDAKKPRVRFPVVSMPDMVGNLFGSDRSAATLNRSEQYA